MLKASQFLFGRSDINERNDKNMNFWAKQSIVLAVKLFTC